MNRSAATDFDTIEGALAALRDGKPVLVLDDHDRENEGDVILAGHSLTDSWLAWTIRHTSGYICAPMPSNWADRLDLPMMVPHNQDRLKTAYTITVDAVAGVTTGISAADRAHTIRLLAQSDSVAADFVRPGHVVPLRARDGGVLVRPGHTEAAVDLCRLAGLPPVGAIAELVNDDGTMMRTHDVLKLGRTHELPVITIADLIAWRERHDRVTSEPPTTMPTGYGDFTIRGYRDHLTGAEHVALISPHGLHPANHDDAPRVRVHSECLTGDVFASKRCDCGPQLDSAMRELADHPGAIIYLRGHEGRGVGLVSKLAAYRLQDEGRDTVDAQLDLGLPIDAREYGAAVAVLHHLGLTRVQLLTNNPAKETALLDGGVTVTGLTPVLITPNHHNVRYLDTKRDRLGHHIPLAQEA